MLLMKKQFFDAIRTGRKTTTLRYWRSPLVAAGSVHNIRGLGRIRIDQVLPVRLQDLTAADARADGFETLTALKRALKEMYPTRSSGDRRRLYQIHFTFLPEAGSSDASVISTR